MGWSDVYLLAQGGDADSVAYAVRAAEVLRGMGVIGVADSEHEGWFGSGERSLDPFEHGVEHEYGFDWCVIYGKPPLMLVPTDEIVEPRCPKCWRDVGKPYYELQAVVNGELSERWETGFDDARVTCPGCGGSFRLDQLKDALGEGIYLS